MNILNVKSLKVRKEGKELLKGVNFSIKKGQIQALLGPNGSGKSTFSNAIMGIKDYQTEGKIIFNNKDISKLSSDKRAKLGIGLIWQNPPSIQGLKLRELIEKMSLSVEELGEDNLFEKEVNKGISGGEKKISELIQIIHQKPKFVIFDEIDSGLDIKKIEKVSKLIKEKLIENDVSILIITHQGEILDFLKPEIVNIMIDGKIVCKGRDYRKVIKTIKKYDYQKCKECKLG